MKTQAKLIWDCLLGVVVLGCAVKSLLMAIPIWRDANEIIEAQGVGIVIVMTSRLIVFSAMIALIAALVASPAWWDVTTGWRTFFVAGYGLILLLTTSDLLILLIERRHWLWGDLILPVVMIGLPLAPVVIFKKGYLGLGEVIGMRLTRGRAEPDAAPEPPPAAAVQDGSETMNPKPKSEASADSGGR